LRNGTSLPNTTGNSNFNIGASDGSSAAIVHNPALANTYGSSLLPAGREAKSSEQVGNGTFSFS
jgi:hypothetical protein